MVPKIHVVKATDTPGWNPAPSSGQFLVSLLDALKIRPLQAWMHMHTVLSCFPEQEPKRTILQFTIQGEAGMLFVEVSPAMELAGKLHPEIVLWTARTPTTAFFFLLAHVSPSPAKKPRISRFLGEMPASMYNLLCL